MLFAGLEIEVIGVDIVGDEEDVCETSDFLRYLQHRRPSVIAEYQRAAASEGRVLSASEHVWSGHPDIPRRITAWSGRFYF